jgi:poly(3-hydroxybutyrate) depolymerase
LFHRNRNVTVQPPCNLAGTEVLDMRSSPTFAALLVLAACLAPQASAGTASTTTYSETTPLSSNTEIVRRMVSAETRARVMQSGVNLASQPLDPADEQFLVYVPTDKPATGYGLLVFVPPWKQARIPDGWADVLDRYGFILVTPANSGNDVDDFARRIPLALIAEQNIVKRYAIDPDKIFVGGFSGGARVALKLALGYPDLFRGALLDAGADPIGTDQLPLPPPDLFAQFQDARLVLVAGDGDTGALRMDAASLSSLRAHCVLNTEEQVLPSVGHVIADRGAFASALGALLKPQAAQDRAACSK